MGCAKRYFGKQQFITSILIDPRRINLLEVYRAKNLYFRQYDKMPTTLYIGNETYSQLMSDPDVRNFGQFSFQLPLDHDTLAGLNVQVMPHMEGWLLI